MSLTLHRVHGCERCLRRHVQVVHKNQAALSKGWAIAALLPAMRGADAAICCEYQDRPLRYLNPILCPYSKMIAPRSAEGQRPVSLLSSLPSITSCVRQLWHARHVVDQSYRWLGSKRSPTVLVVLRLVCTGLGTEGKGERVVLPQWLFWTAFLWKPWKRGDMPSVDFTQFPPLRHLSLSPTVDPCGVTGSSHSRSWSANHTQGHSIYKKLHAVRTYYYVKAPHSVNGLCQLRVA